MFTTSSRIPLCTMLLCASLCINSTKIKAMNRDLEAQAKLTSELEKIIISGSLEDFNKQLARLQILSPNDFNILQENCVFRQKIALDIVRLMKDNPILQAHLDIMHQEIVAEKYLVPQYISANIELTDDLDHKLALQLLYHSSQTIGSCIVAIRKKMLKLSPNEVSDYITKEESRLNAINDILTQEGIACWKKREERVRMMIH